jgi:hypothetical protein
MDGEWYGVRGGGRSLSLLFVPRAPADEQGVDGDRRVLAVSIWLQLKTSKTDLSVLSLSIAFTIFYLRCFCAFLPRPSFYFLAQ